ncbi:hypothetical protein PV08_05214 [Exophiala spinifera]|uniref:Uncharacterized protein n=1 Tax=Exophiala spinifera TaxID=91928 RepID=A0A0D2BV86_9EURO|nr:uncharacterized protein PV08_05214 [Exophiala spinifera]KIW15169.1 hypothetical protein PV08_05214 [Exophiala spinifera]
MKVDPQGIHYLGRDGVLRSFTADREVIDAVGLAPKHIKALLDRTPYMQEAEDIFRCVDGTKVPREKWFNPDKSDIPRTATEEEKERERIMVEEFKKEGILPGSRCCGPATMSDYRIL